MKRIFYIGMLLTLALGIQAQNRTVTIHKKDGSKIELMVADTRYFDSFGKPTIKDGDYTDTDSLHITPRNNAFDAYFWTMSWRPSIQLLMGTEPDSLEATGSESFFRTEKTDSLQRENPEILYGTWECLNLEYGTTYYYRSAIEIYGMTFQSEIKTLYVEYPIHMMVNRLEELDSLYVYDAIPTKAAVALPTSAAWDALIAANPQYLTPSDTTKKFLAYLWLQQEEHYRPENQEGANPVACCNGTIYTMDKVPASFMERLIESSLETTVYNSLALCSSTTIDTWDVGNNGQVMEYVRADPQWNIPGNSYINLYSTGNQRNARVRYAFEVAQPLLPGNTYKVSIVLAPQTDSTAVAKPTKVGCIRMLSGMMVSDQYVSTEILGLTEFDTLTECVTLEATYTPTRLERNAIYIESYQQRTTEFEKQLRIAEIRVEYVKEE